MNYTCIRRGHSLAIASGNEKICSQCKMTESQLEAVEKKRIKEVARRRKMYDEAWAFYSNQVDRYRVFCETNSKVGSMKEFWGNYGNW
jgi:hypothetical protein